MKLQKNDDRTSSLAPLYILLKDYYNLAWCPRFSVHMYQILMLLRFQWDIIVTRSCDLITWYSTYCVPHSKSIEISFVHGCTCMWCSRFNQGISILFFHQSKVITYLCLLSAMKSISVWVENVKWRHYRHRPSLLLSNTLKIIQKLKEKICRRK